MPETPEMQRARVDAFGAAMVRSEKLLTAAITFREDEDVWQRLMDDATAIADEWNFSPDLRQIILDAARENVALGRVL